MAEGRRIYVTRACDNPTAADIGDCCSHLKLSYAIERGRVRAQFKREDGTSSNPAIPSRKQLMLHVAELVPMHPGRTKKQEPTSTSSSGPSRSGKSRKKKR